MIPPPVYAGGPLGHTWSPRALQRAEPTVTTFSNAGELLTDQARGITAVYDGFSMPRTITTPQGRLDLTYDAPRGNGEGAPLPSKWRQRAFGPSGALLSQESTYGAVQYRGTKPYAISHAHGRARFDDPNTGSAWT